MILRDHSNHVFMYKYLNIQSLGCLYTCAYKPVSSMGVQKQHFDEEILKQKYTLEHAQSCNVCDMYSGTQNSDY